MRWLSAEYRLAALAFIVSVVFVPTIFSAPFMPRWWALSIGLPLLCDLGPRSVDRIIGALLLLGFGWIALQFTYIEDWFSALLPLYFLILCGLTFIAASNVDDFDPTLVALCLGVGISSVGAFLQKTDIWAWGLLNQHEGALFLNSEVLAEIAAPLCIWALVSRRPLLAAIVGCSILVVDSRIAVLGLIVGLFVAYGPRALWKKSAIVGVLALIAFIAMTLIGGKIGSLDHRLTLWGAGIYSLTVFGEGLGWWAAAHPFGFEEFVHSDLLQFLVELGIGGLFFIAIPVVVFARGIKDKALGACFAVLCFEATVSFPLHVPATAFLFFGMAGFLARAGYCVRDAERESRVYGRGHLQRQSPYGPGVAAYGSDYRRILWD